ncbi:MAG: hypothetical protein Q7P63_14480 [Verrucomicrobiota bacterium JB022]|nr:hypothetical protein [Verrucomicrobiota bacterium JB022]
MASMVQLNPYIPVSTPLGTGLALLIIDYGMSVNSCWVVALKEDGRIKHFDSNDVFLRPNYTYGMNLQGAAPEPGKPGDDAL